jgi:hypothetical protein
MITLNEIAPYLPYKINAKNINDDKIVEVIGLYTNKKDEDSILYRKYKSVIDDLYLRNSLLILRPLSNITKDEVMEFVGTVLNFKSRLILGFNFTYNEGFLVIQPIDFNYPSFTVLKPDNEGNPLFNRTYSLKESQWLFSKHFDVFGLIARGDAIDINAL